MAQWVVGYEEQAPLMGCQGRHGKGSRAENHAPYPTTTFPMRVARRVYRDIYHYGQTLERLNERGGFSPCEIVHYYRFEEQMAERRHSVPNPTAAVG